MVVIDKARERNRLEARTVNIDFRPGESFQIATIAKGSSK